jgi:endonuclease YncB( thermonuclease family)
VIELLKKAPLAGAFFVGVCLSLAAPVAALADAACRAPTGLPRVAVRSVVDGDTLRLVDGRSVRLIGLNAPELGRKGRTDEPFAVVARRRLQALVDASDGQVLVQPGAEAKDKYGRILAYLYDRDGASLEDPLLREGLAFHVAIAPNVARVDCQQRAEAHAQAGALGLWRGSPVIAASQLRQSGFAVVGGQVGAVQRNRGGTWVTVGDNLVVNVPPRLQVAAARIDSWRGQRVQVRGWVLDRARRGGLQPGQARWMIRLTDASMLQTGR